MLWFLQQLNYKVKTSQDFVKINGGWKIRQNAEMLGYSPVLQSKQAKTISQLITFAVYEPSMGLKSNSRLLKERKSNQEMCTVIGTPHIMELFKDDHGIVSLLD